jgi:hypothetical protein
MMFNVIDKYRPGFVVQQIEADYVTSPAIGQIYLYRSMPWYRRDRLVGIVRGLEYFVGAVPQTPDVKELERMVRL